MDIDFTQTDSALAAIEKFCPQEIYNLAAVSSVASSWQNPILAMEVNGYAVERLIRGICELPNLSEIRFFQAGSTDMVGKSLISSQETYFSPWSPYGESKELARKAIVCARNNFGLWAVNGLLTNHDSEYRKQSFVIPIIAKQIIEVTQGFRQNIQLENPSIARDWAHAKDIMEGAWKMMQLERPLDLTLATGISSTLTNLIEQCATVLDIKLKIEQTREIPSRNSDFPSITIDARFTHEILRWIPEYSGPKTLLSLVRALK